MDEEGAVCLSFLVVCASMSASSRWPPAFMAGDSHEVALYKKWINKENALAQSFQRGEIHFDHKPTLRRDMSSHLLEPQPSYAAASSHLRGCPRYDWARFAGEPSAGYDPVVGYNMRWASNRSKTPAPFSMYRARSTSNLEFGTALEPLNVKPVVRRARPPMPKLVAQPQVHRTLSLNELAPEEAPRRKARTEYGNDNGSGIAALAFTHT